MSQTKAQLLDGSVVSVAFSAGSVGAPSLYFTGDTNTGIYSPGADTLAFVEGGIEAMRIDSSGRVGIGTSSPGTTLDVVGNSRFVFGTGATNTGDQNVIIAGLATTGAHVSSYGAALQFQITNSTGGYAGARILSRLNADNNTANLVFQARNYGFTDSMTLDSSGRLLVGTSSGRNIADSVQAGIQFETTAFGGISITNNRGDASSSNIAFGKQRSGAIGGNTIVQNGDGLGSINFAGADGTDLETVGANITAFVDGTPGANDMPGRLVFSTTADGAASPTERMRISQNGNVSIGVTSNLYNSRLACSPISGASGSAFFTDTATEFGTILVNVATSGNNGFALFQTEATPVTRGSITYNRGGGVVAYNTTSDYRAKTLLGAVENPGETIDTLKVYRGVMNGATVERPMLVAHEAQKVAPYCVTGEKDAVDDDGNPVYQQMDHQVLVPLLIAEIQQLRARVAALETA